MIEQIIKLREEGLSFRKIAKELNTTVGKVQYRFNRWVETHVADDPSESLQKETEALEASNLHELPKKGVLQIRPVSPLKIIAFWDVSQLSKRLIQLYFNQCFEELVHVIRIFDVKDIMFNGTNAHSVYEIAIPYENGHWMIKGLSPDRSYIAELGVYLSEKEYFPLLRSSSIQTPFLGPKVEVENFIEYVRTEPVQSNPPRWKDHVSTYSYYESQNILEGKHDASIIPAK